ncbi:MAG: hypothetical protein ABSD76_02090 [Terriglobales bacterium]|jgi:hypothetical protein
MRATSISVLGVIFFVGTFAFAQMPPVAGCGLPRLDGTLQVPKVFIYEDGWTIPGLTGASVVGTDFDETGNQVIHYKPTEDVELDLQGFQISADGHSLKFVPGYVQLVTDILQFRILGRTYAYDVVSVSLRRAEPPMWQRVQKAVSQQPERKHRTRLVPGGVLGCGFTTLRYFDTDGDGRFESLEYVGFGAPYASASSCSTAPEWALKLLPNRMAAERCTKERSERDLKTSETLRQLLDYRPALPVLQPKQ